MEASTHLAILKQGVDAWNTWRIDNPDVQAELNGADLTDAILITANLSDAECVDTILYEANFSDANLTGVDFTRADFTNAYIGWTIFATLSAYPVPNGRNPTHHCITWILKTTAPYRCRLTR